jgi:hypothetical protein
MVIHLTVIAAITWYVALWNPPFGPASTPAPAGPVFVDPSPRIDEPAPDFTLTHYQEDGEWTLSSARGEKPVVLIFGSYTCPSFRDQIPALNRVYLRYKDRAEFYFIYIREAHPAESGPILENEELGPPIRQHQSLEERSQIASLCALHLDVKMPVLVDDLQNTTERKYHAWPERLYVVGADGKIAYRGLGAGDFNIAAMTATLEKTLSGPGA